MCSSSNRRARVRVVVLSLRATCEMFISSPARPSATSSRTLSVSEESLPASEATHPRSATALLGALTSLGAVDRWPADTLAARAPAGAGLSARGRELLALAPAVGTSGLPLMAPAEVIGSSEVSVASRCKRGPRPGSRWGRSQRPTTRSNALVGRS